MGRAQSPHVGAMPAKVWLRIHLRPQWQVWGSKWLGAMRQKQPRRRELQRRRRLTACSLIALS